MGRASFAAAHPNRGTVFFFTSSPASSTTTPPSPSPPRLTLPQSSSAPTMPAMQSGLSPAAETEDLDVVSVHGRARAVAAQRDSLSSHVDGSASLLDQPSVSARHAPLVSALRGLVRELEDLTDEQEAVIIRLRREAAGTGAVSENAQRRFNSLKAALRQAVEKNVDIARRTHAKQDEILALKSAIAAADAANKSAASERRELEASFAAKVLEFEARIACDADRRAASDAEWARQADRAATLEQQLRATRRDADGASEEAKALASKLADAEYELLYLTEAAKRADQLAIKQRQLVAARAKDAERAAKDAKMASEEVRERDERIADIESRLATAAAADAVAIRERNDRIEELESSLANADLKAATAIREKDCRIAELDANLADASARAASVGERDARIAELESSLATANAEAASVEERDTRIAELESALATANAYADVVRERDARIAHLESTLAAADAHGTVVREQDGHIAALEAELLAQKAAASERVCEREERIAALEARVAAAEADCAADAAAVQEALRKTAASENELANALTTCADLKAEVEHLQATCTNYASVIAVASHQLTASTDLGYNIENEDEACTIGDNREEPVCGFLERKDDVADENVSRTGCDRVPFAESSVDISQSNSLPLASRTSASKTTVTEGNKSRKFVFRVDVPDFKPEHEIAPTLVSSVPPAGKCAKTATQAGAKFCSDSSYSNLFWCPPGTTTKTLTNTVHKSDGEHVQVVEVVGDRWADGFALWYDLATALIPDAGCATSPPAEGSGEYWSAIETAFLSVGGDDEEDAVAPAPIVFIVRNTASLAPANENTELAGSCAYEACQKIWKLLEILHGIHSSLIADRFSVSIVLEGWPSSVPLGSHYAQSLALPRVSRRSGKAKRFNKRVQHCAA